MGNIILRGISSALVVTVITLLAGMLWSTMGYGGLNPSSLVDIGLAASCLVAGYRSGKEGGVWIWGGASALGYVGLAILLATLFLPISGWGAAQILAEGGLMGVLAGAVGAGKASGKKTGWQSPLFSSRVSRWGADENKWDVGNRWDSSADYENRESINSREINNGDAPDTGSDGEWEEWMGEDLRLSGEKKEKTYKQYRDDKEKEREREKEKEKEKENRIAPERKRWWEEDAY
ncbi:TIGR04086 family membrane protein [Desulfitobacterium sp.]|uniref:TIGR04086 family membrane protein n=1 Tax=Desulfitobacterium sp. TaxID=49981 RepID=UPI002B1F6911|nr:TIGR04086 family membrane protein [Desulfitobacterium sp.]MEA4902356.1 TIGR04086 family membrane protein [Desulfitobacterium sp.]